MIESSTALRQTALSHVFRDVYSATQRQTHNTAYQFPYHVTSRQRGNEHFYRGRQIARFTHGLSAVVSCSGVLWRFDSGRSMESSVATLTVLVPCSDQNVAIMQQITITHGQPGLKADVTSLIVVVDTPNSSIYYQRSAITELCVEASATTPLNSTLTVSPLFNNVKLINRQCQLRRPNVKRPTIWNRRFKTTPNA